MFQHKRTKVLSLLVSSTLVLACIAAATAVSGRFMVKPTVATATGDQSGFTSINPQNSMAIQERIREPVENIRFTVYEEGLFPSEQTVTFGVVGVAVEDRTGRSTGLIIQREELVGLISVGEVNRVQNHWRGRAHFRLLAGTYRVIDRSRPNNWAKLIVEAR